MSGFLDSIREVIGNGWNPDVPTEGVRPDYGLGTAQFRPMQKSQYEPTLESGETRSPQDLQSMLAGVIEAAGMAALPGIGPKLSRLPQPTSTELPTRYFHTTLDPNFKPDMGRPIHLNRGRATPGWEGNVHSFQLPEGAKIPMVADAGIMWNDKRQLLRAGIINDVEFRSEQTAPEILKSKGYAPAVEYPNAWEGTHNKEKVFPRAQKLAGQRLGIPWREVPTEEILPNEWIGAGVKSRSTMVLDPSILKYEMERTRQTRGAPMTAKSKAIR